MPALIVKGEVIRSFIDGLSAVGEKTSEVRLEVAGGSLLGNYASHSRAALADARLSLDGIETDEVDGLLVGVDLVDLQLIPRFVGKEDTMSMRFEEGRCKLSFGPGRRSFKLLANSLIPAPFTSKPVLRAGWKLPKEIVKPLVDTLSLEGGPVLTIRKDGDGDTSLKLSTKDYGGLNTADYLIAGSVLKEYEGPPFQSMFDFELFSCVKGIPTEADIAFRCDDNYPIEMVGVKGPVTTRIMLAPRIVAEG